MDTVTYPDQDVQVELESWVFARFDASASPADAKALGVRAVPVAIALDGDRVLGRLENFIEPEALCAWLHDMRTKRKE